ncbi:probable membrane-associated kinase regulator 4 [Euphorbia lathyris]|uniref:probable membrane-associated kinase regulator 4 n=1 Tax=Euphorbia lathyris TaxID=212925 RepID=UPI003313F7AD
MEANLLSYDQADDDFIDMEVSSFSHLLCNSKISISAPTQPREFEFHNMTSLSLEKELTTSPADELFYKGKLLPLHLPPRLQMVEKLLQHSNSTFSSRKDHNFEEFYSTPSMATPTTSTPFESCNISPSESCQISREINPEEYFFEYSNEASDFSNPKKSWTRKLKLIKQTTTIGSRLKASRAYLRSFFGKSGCSDDSTKVADEGTISKAKESLTKCEKPPKKAPFGQIQKEKVIQIPNFENRKSAEDGNGRIHRRSFSMALRRNSTNKSSTSSSSSSSSSNTNGFYGLPFLKRSSSVNSEVENPIQGAIAHCKQSQSRSQAQQQLFCSNKVAAEVGFYPLPASRIAICEEQELCRG